MIMDALRKAIEVKNTFQDSPSVIFYSVTLNDIHVTTFLVS
jgi:hypothetical protein